MDSRLFVRVFGVHMASGLIALLSTMVSTVCEAHRDPCSSVIISAFRVPARSSSSFPVSRPSYLNLRPHLCSGEARTKTYTAQESLSTHGLCRVLLSHSPPLPLDLVQGSGRQHGSLLSGRQGDTNADLR